MSCAAIMAVLSLLFRRPVPNHYAVVAEVCPEGELYNPELMDSTLLYLARANGVTYILTTRFAALKLRAWKAKDQRRLGGVRVLEVSSMRDVMETFFDT